MTRETRTALEAVMADTVRITDALIAALVAGGDDLARTALEQRDPVRRLKGAMAHLGDLGRRDHGTQLVTWAGALVMECDGLYGRVVEAARQAVTPAPIHDEKAAA